ncbi:LysM peptidoglycan-binding domain-containing protein [Rossellomorea sp. SC111]|uniref:LysM peptidoglycan-binding domain-containing protein n=1 Tax=Rossellomorea sp. SC111 TaxID=2968985 RepID=UPI00215A74BC|nr:LysM peptidoglycan-binding domain-containing protein [Rossellomorea sp. SC111]MCR8846981.1 LysM peptidoglycan-binding domain-containing protein [Rossellomorea sp. SC111]
MSKDPYRDQAAKKKIKIERVPEEPPAKKREPLPPRSELHRDKHKKNKWKMKYPLISMLLLFFILLPLTVFGLYSFFDHRNGPLVVMSEDVDDVVEVRYDQSENEKEGSEAAADPKTEEDPPETEQKNASSKESASSTGEKNQQASAPPPKETVEKPKEQIKKETKEEPQETKKEEPKVKVVYHTVKPQETLYRIAMNYYHSPSGVDRIKEWNKIQDTDIQTGQVLEIPLDQ